MTPEYRESLCRWLEYYICTEEFDRGVCRFSDAGGTAIPSTPGEREACTTNAMAERRRLELDRWPEGRDEASRLNYEGCKETLSVLSRQAGKAAP